MEMIFHNMSIDVRPFRQVSETLKFHTVVLRLCHNPFKGIITFADEELTSEVVLLEFQTRSLINLMNGNKISPFRNSEFRHLLIIEPINQHDLHKGYVMQVDRWIPDARGMPPSHPRSRKSWTIFKQSILYHELRDFETTMKRLNEPQIEAMRR